MTKACSCTFALLPLAIVIGLGIGHFFPEFGTMLGTASDPVVLLLLTLVFFEARFGPNSKHRVTSAFCLWHGWLTLF